MANDLTTLGEYIKVQGGFAFKSKDFSKNGKNKVLKIKNVRFGNIDYSDCAYVSDEVARAASAWATNEGDILISMTGSGPNAPQSLVGRVARVWKGEPKSLINQRVGRIQSKNESLIHSDFIFYLLSLPQSQEFLVANSSGSANQANISGKIIELLPCPKISFERSKKIADIARSLDEKIILNKKSNQTLEQMAQALFKSWFVDFDPVVDNALAAGSDIPDALQHRVEIRRKAHALQKQNPNIQPLPSATQRLFPSEFEHCGDNTLGIHGWIPKGWQTKSVDECIYINPKISLPKGTLAKFADMKALPTSGYGINGIIEKSYTGGAKFQQGDVLLARITPCLQNGKTGVVDFMDVDNEVGFGSTEFIVMRRKGGLGTPFISCLSRDENFRNHCMQSMVGSSGRQRIQNACFSSYFLALPPTEKVLNTFQNIVAPMFSRMTINNEETKSLTNLRDLLLPKLISGDIKVNKDVS